MSFDSYRKRHIRLQKLEKIKDAAWDFVVSARMGRGVDPALEKLKELERALVDLEYDPRMGPDIDPPPDAG